MKIQIKNELIYRIINRAYNKYLTSKLTEFLSVDLRCIEKEISNQSKNIFFNNHELIVDKAAYIHIKIASLIQASYLVLLKEINDKEIIIGILKYALVEAFRTYLAIPLNIILTISKSEFIKLINILPIKSANNMIFGKGFTMETITKDANIHEFIYKSCLYNEFFHRNSTPELTQILCYADSAWIDVINQGKHPIQFERPSTLANGQDKCIFKFVKLNKK